MPSYFGWIDSSEEHRREMLDVIDRFREQDTRDELGIAPIRDGFADLLFPGTGALQTRARYFLFIPWLYLRLEKRRVPAREAPQKGRKAEIALIEVLLKSADANGTIGERARGALKRLPSNVYWHGLGIWGIRQFSGSQSEYHGSLDRSYRQGLLRVRDDEATDQDALPGIWHAGLPNAPIDFPDEASFELRRDEAEYLRDRIRSRASSSLLAILLDPGARKYDDEFPWNHARLAEFPTDIRTQLWHARNFSEAMHGAALLYNLMLAEMRAIEKRIDEYAGALEGWRRALDSRQSDLARWDRTEMWSIMESHGVRVSTPMRGFVEKWIGIALDPRQRKAAAHDHAARELIAARERSLKGPLARVDSARALELWGGASGARQLAYRWPVASRLLRDITTGLGSA
ncbi:MAG: DUF6361 family protein [bacterium]